MIDFSILRECGTTNERLREFFTATAAQADKEGLSEEQKKAILEDVKKCKEFQLMLGSWIQEHVIYSLTNAHLYSAVDMAWDSSPINKRTMPLMLYAQGSIDLDAAKTALKDVPNGDTYLRKNPTGAVVGLDLPKFVEMNVNVVRSVITRRTAAQYQKYDLWPWFKYEPRSTTQLGRLRGDLTSQRMDIMADAYDYRHFQDQVCRDMLLYPNGAVAFPRASWEREVQWEREVPDPDSEAGYKTEGEGENSKKAIKKKAVVVKEGVSWTLPHRSRVFADNSFSIGSLNTDTGCKYIGFWDVARWKDVRQNPDYFNRDAVTYSQDTAAWFDNYSWFFNQYFDKIKPPVLPSDSAQQNDRATNVGIYTGAEDETGVFFTHIWVNVRDPRALGWGTYPYPIWVHLKVAGNSTVVYADIMPSSPAAVAQFNCHDNRLMNISVAHELMQYQDQLTNLYSQMLETIKADLFSVAILNEDIFPDTDEGKKVKEEFKATLSGKNYYASMQVLCASFEKLSQVLGREITADMVFKVVRMPPNVALTAIFEAITRVLAMADRLMVMSAHETGQAASHELTATESSQIAGSTDTVYSYISKGLDEFRAAQKRICYESLMACGEREVVLPVANRYPAGLIAKAGFKIVDQDDENEPVGYMTVMGQKHSLGHDYIFTTRDGGNRSSNSQAAQTLVQLLQGIGSLEQNIQRAIIGGMGKSKVYEILNAIFRLADVGVDLKLELKAGEGDSLLVEDDQQVMGAIQQLAQAVKKNSLDQQQQQQLLGSLQSAVAQVSQQPKEGLRESIDLGALYKLAPESVRRQIERAAGLQPAGLAETALELSRKLPPEQPPGNGK